MTTFIGEYKIDDSICDRLIEHHKNGKKKQGLSGYDMIDKDTKDSIDVAGKDIPYYYDYLNDVTDEGETEFFYQKRIIQPRKGLTLIWPASWTHTHKGVPSLTQEKYIITGWISFRDYVDQK